MCGLHLEEVLMHRFDFDVVSDPLPARRIPGPPRAPGAAEKQSESRAPAPKGDGGAAKPASDEAS
jgi:hypothetical protein